MLFVNNRNRGSCAVEELCFPVCVKVVLDGAGFVLPEYNLESQQTPLFLCWEARKQVTHTSETMAELHIPAMREREKVERWSRDWTAVSKSIKGVV